MNLKAITSHKMFRPAVAAALVIGCGLLLLTSRVGDWWINGSYDCLFLFGCREPANKVVLISMDNDSLESLKQVKTNWSRQLHADLLNLLTDSAASIVVFDVFFRDKEADPGDKPLADAMQKHGRVVIEAKLTDPDHPKTELSSTVLPKKLFLDAARDWGIGQADPSKWPARRHWPFEASNSKICSLPWAAARVAGAELPRDGAQQWLRYYGQRGGWETYSYDLVLSNRSEFKTNFNGRIVFIGRAPDSTDPGVTEDDKFSMARTDWWNNPAVGGVKILATTFLNLLNGDWLRRPPPRLEILLLIATGGLLGAGFYYVRPSIAWIGGIGIAIMLMLGAATLSYHTNYWFPWLIISGGQIPCAIAVSIVAARARRTLLPLPAPTVRIPDHLLAGDAPRPLASTAEERPDAPDYTIYDPPFGEGSYGKVWVVRNAIGQWQALKAIYLGKFGPHADPYDREFNGIRRYKPISDRHPGLLRVDFVSTKKPGGYFYYVMELGDAMTSGWEKNPAQYVPRDLSRTLGAAVGHRLPIRECVRIGLALTEALEFLHEEGLTHRDIKPQNIIFVNNRPKLADIGLVAEILPPGKQNTLVGTPGYMPPPPEPAGTPQADIYGLGMVLYVIRTGQQPSFFPDVSSTLIASAAGDSFAPFNAVILQACQPHLALRYKTAAEMRHALLEVQKILDQAKQPSTTMKLDTEKIRNSTHEIRTKSE